MKVTVFRTAMVGGGLSYDVYVRSADVPEQMTPDANGNTHTRIIRDDGRGRRVEWFDYVDATQSAEHRAMPLGWARYDDSRAHELRARREMLALARRAFPELDHYQGETLPTLWVTGLVPRQQETSAVVEVTS